jgi:tRNA-Thr(GGU) m(6)t(6)A37 methyltransferase TsaA
MKAELRQIGVVRSGIRERKQMPSLGAPALIEVFEPFLPALLRFEKHSHIWVLAWLDQAERDVLQVTPRGVEDRSPAGLHGVFAVRSPVRPNPIGMTACRVVERREGEIKVDRLDFLEGTPIIDIKPYFVTRDAILAANNAQIGRPASREALRESLWLQAVHFHGEECAELERAVEAIWRFRCEALDGNEPEAWDVTVPVHRGCAIDAVIGMTRATPGRGSLKFHAEDTIAVRYGGGTHRYAL